MFITTSHVEDTFSQKGIRQREKGKIRLANEWQVGVLKLSRIRYSVKSSPRDFPWRSFSNQLTKTFRRAAPDAVSLWITEISFYSRDTRDRQEAGFIKFQALHRF